MRRFLRHINAVKLYVIFVTVITFGGVVNAFPIIRFFYLSAIVLSLYYIIKNKLSFSSKLVFALFLISIIALLSSFLTNSPILYYQQLVLASFIAFLAVSVFSYNYKEISDYIYIVCRIVCVLGAINFVLYTFVPDMYVEMTNDNSGYFVYSISYFFNYLPHKYHFITRNQGLFWEPGVFAVVLNLHLFDVLIERSKNFKKAILPIFLIITTFSTSGLVLMTCIVSYWFFFIRKMKFIYGIVIGSFFAAVFVPFLIDNTKEKVDQDSQSAAIRAYDLYMGVEIIKSYPMFGVGMNPDNYLKLTKTVDIGPFDINSFDTSRGCTNTFISVASRLGIPLLLLFVLGIYNQKIYKKNSLFMLVMFLALSSEPLFDLPFIFLLLYSAIKLKRHESIRVLKKEHTIESSNIIAIE